ncbi:MAG: hypothetical protein MJZ56_04385 [Bacteroidales bacterium]|nr:hypothetical protein [Bacteroidales bacterium]
MDYPIGEYYCKIDAKGRLSLPSSFQEQIGKSVLNEGFVLRPALFDKCLEMFGMNDWRVMQERLGKLNLFKRENVMLVRRFNAGARLVKPDASGRLQIPKDIMEKCAIEKDVVITALTDRMQIWDKKLMEQEDASVSEEDFINMLSQKLGNENDVR